MIKKIESLAKDNLEFQTIIEDLINNEVVQEMKKYRQHCFTSCFEHCYAAAFYCYTICKKLNLDYKSATRAAMLHDLFLYDWREKGNRNGFHAFTHGKAAYQNASKLFELNDIEKDMITKHMWPVTIKPPKYKETLVLTFVDKYCATSEIYEYYSKKQIIYYINNIVSSFVG